jgi:predicted ArsR family transcriptional regulator
MFKFFRARATDAITSFQAADSIKDVAKMHQEVIVACLQRFGPLGKDGIATQTGLQSNQVARRLSELEKMGLIELTGQTVKSNSGRQEREWRFKPVQQELL